MKKSLTVAEFREILGRLEKRPESARAAARASVGRTKAATGKMSESDSAGSAVTRRAGDISASRRAAHRGRIKDPILGVLRSAGDKGLVVDDIADRTGLSPRHITIWFNQTGKWLANVRKVGPSRWAWIAETKA